MKVIRSLLLQWGRHEVPHPIQGSGINEGGRRHIEMVKYGEPVKGLFLPCVRKIYTKR